MIDTELRAEIVALIREATAPRSRFEELDRIVDLVSQHLFYKDPGLLDALRNAIAKERGLR